MAKKFLETAIVYKMGPLKFVDYFGGALAIWDEEKSLLKIFSEDLERLFELAFLGVHSFLGQRLDESFLCRVHALGISYHQVNTIVMLPSKGGKSTLLTHLLENPDVKILSDDTPLIDRHGLVHPFPTKISLNSMPTTGPLKNLTWHEFKREVYPAKWTASLSQLASRVETTTSAKKTLLVAGFRVSQGESLLVPVSRVQMIKPLLEHMIIGVGLPQVVEFFLSFSFFDLFKMTKHFLIRSWCAFKLAQNAECFHFYMGKDSDYNSQILLDLADEHNHS